MQLLSLCEKNELEKIWGKEPYETLLYDATMAEGIVSDARHRLLRTSNYTGLQIAAIVLLNPVMIGKWKKKKEKGTDHYAPSFSIVFYLKVIFLLSANPLSVWRLLPSAFINQTLQGHTGFQEKKKKWEARENAEIPGKKQTRNSNKGMFLSSGRVSFQHPSSCTALPQSANSFLCLTFSSPPLTPGAASFVIRQVMRAMLLTLTSTPPLMRYNLCCFMFAEPRAKAWVR